MTDRLFLVNALADAKIDRPAAECIATEIFEAIHDSVASKADLQHLEGAMARISSAWKLQSSAWKLQQRATSSASKLALRPSSLPYGAKWR